MADNHDMSESRDTSNIPSEAPERSRELETDGERREDGVRRELPRVEISPSASRGVLQPATVRMQDETSPDTGQREDDISSFQVSPNSGRLPDDHRNSGIPMNIDEIQSFLEEAGFPASLNEERMLEYFAQSDLGLNEVFDSNEMYKLVDFLADPSPPSSYVGAGSSQGSGVESNARTQEHGTRTSSSVPSAAIAATPGEEATIAATPGEEATIAVTPGEEATNAVTPGEEATNAATPGEEATSIMKLREKNKRLRESGLCKLCESLPSPRRSADTVCACCGYLVCSVCASGLENTCPFCQKQMLKVLFK